MGMLQGFTECWLLGATCQVDWTAWSAVATAAAVGVALLTSRWALDAERRAREHSDAKAAAEDTALAERLAAVFDHELWMLIGQLEFLGHHLSVGIQQRDLASLRSALAGGVPLQALKLMSENTEQFRVFDRSTAVYLMQAVSAWNSISIAPTPELVEQAPDDYLVRWAQSTFNTYAGIVEELRTARAAVRPIAKRVNPRSPGLDR